MQTDLVAQCLGRGQLGLVTRRQLREAGIDHRAVARRLRDGAWRAPFPTVIDLRTHAASWERSVLAVVLASGDGAVASHATAGHLHGMLDVPRPEAIDVAVPRGGRTMTGAVALHTTVRLRPDERGMVGAVPVTSRLRTVLDLAGRVERGHLELLVGDEVRGRSAAAEELAALARRRPGWRGSSRVLHVLALLGPAVVDAESPLEVRGLALLRHAGITDPEVQGVIRDGGDRFLARADAVWRAERLILEFAGRRFHDTPTRRAADADRRRRLEAEGWRVIEVHHEDLGGDRSRRFLERLRGALAGASRPPGDDA